MSLDDILQEITGQKRDPAYVAKMLHPIPEAPSVERIPAIFSACKGKIVLDIGSTGSELHEALKTIAAKVYGIDHEGTPDFTVDLNASPVPFLSDVQLILCGEVLEHLSNPGFFLDGLHQYSCPILITVPNAFSEIGRSHLTSGTENVNIDHVAWYSYRTFRTLIERHGFSIDSFWWYGGKPRTSEGLLFLIKATREDVNGRT